MAITNITESSTFRAWYLVTNEIINNLNANVVINGSDVYGQFNIKSAANTYLSVANGLYVNSSAVVLSSNVTFSANVVANSSVRSFTIGANTLTLSPLQGTTFTTPILANAAVTVNAAVSVNGAFSTNGTVSITGNPTITGNTDANGTFNVRQLIYATGGAIAANTVAGGTYNDWAPTGLANCSVLNLTPSANIALTGLVAPVNLGASGGRVLYIQNLSGTYSVNLHSANAGSAGANQFKTPGDANVVITPGSALSLIYVTGVNQWRVLSPPMSSTGTQTFGNTIIGGTLGVNGKTTLSGDLSAANLYVNNASGFVGIGKTNPAYMLDVVGSVVASVFITADQMGAVTSMTAPNGSFGAMIANGTGVFVSSYINSISANVRTYTGNTIQLANSISTANITISGHTAAATFAASGNTSLLGGAVLANTSGNTVTFSNTITVNGTTNSYIYTLRVNGLVSDAAINAASLGVPGLATFATNAAFANVTVSANVTMANATFSAIIKASGTGARFVLPVGVNYYAT